MESLHANPELAQQLSDEFDAIGAVTLSPGNQEFFKAWCESQDLCNVRFVSREEYESRRAAGDIWESPVANAQTQPPTNDAHDPEPESEPTPETPLTEQEQFANARPTLILPDDLQLNEMREIAEAINHRFLEDPTDANRQLGENWDAHEEHIAHFRAALRGPLEEILEEGSSTDSSSEDPTPPLPANPDWSWLDDRLARYPELDDPIQFQAEETGVDVETSDPFERFILAAQEGNQTQSLAELLEDIHAAPLRMLITTVHRRAVEILCDTIREASVPGRTERALLRERLKIEERKQRLDQLRSEIPNRQDKTLLLEEIKVFSEMHKVSQEFLLNEATTDRSGVPFAEAKTSGRINCVVHSVLVTEFMNELGITTLPIISGEHVFVFALMCNGVVGILNIGPGLKGQWMQSHHFKEADALKKIKRFAKKPDRRGMRLHIQRIKDYPGIIKPEELRTKLELTDPAFAIEEAVAHNLMSGFIKKKGEEEAIKAITRYIMQYPSLRSPHYTTYGSMFRKSIINREVIESILRYRFTIDPLGNRFDDENEQEVIDGWVEKLGIDEDEAKELLRVRKRYRRWIAVVEALKRAQGRWGKLQDEWAEKGLSPERITQEIGDEVPLEIELALMDLCQALNHSSEALDAEMNTLVERADGLNFELDRGMRSLMSQQDFSENPQPLQAQLDALEEIRSQWGQLEVPYNPPGYEGEAGIRRDWANIERLITKGLIFDPENTLARRSLALDYATRGGFAMHNINAPILSDEDEEARGYYEKALKIYQAAAKLNNKDPELRIQMAEVHTKLGNHKEAVFGYLYLCKIDPKNAEKYILELFFNLIRADLVDPTMEFIFGTIFEEIPQKCFELIYSYYEEVTEETGLSPTLVLRNLRKAVHKIPDPAKRKDLEDQMEALMGVDRIVEE